MSPSISESQLQSPLSDVRPLNEPSITRPIDDELPPSARANTNGNSKSTPPKRKPIAKVWSWRKPLLCALSVLMLAAYWSWSGSESSHQDWRNHEQATERWEGSQGSQSLKWVTPMGPAHFVDTIFMGADDFDLETTEAVLEQGYRGDAAAVDQIVQNAQQDLADAKAAITGLPDVPDLDPVTPTLTSGMRSEILNGDAQFFHIFLYDSCAQDGDIVDIVLNGHRFATVPITNAGTTLSIPVSSTTAVAIRGLWDGGGGITVACQTSQGSGFVRVLHVGEEQLLAIVAQ